MTKIGVPALIGMGLSLAGSAAGMMAQRSHARKQDQANQDWMNYQNMKTKMFERKDEEDRRKAQAELDRNLENSTGEAREEVIANETNRLSDVFGGSDENIANVTANLVGAGQGGGVSKVFDKHFAANMAETTAAAKKRIEAMAKTAAYGGGSRHGMGMHDMLNNTTSQNVIGGIAGDRAGDARVLNNFREVEPRIIPYETPIFASILQGAGGLVGGLGSNAFSGVTNAAQPTVNGFAATPKIGPIPTFNPLAPR